MPNTTPPMTLIPEQRKRDMLALVMALSRSHEVWYGKATRILAQYELAMGEFDVLSTLERSPEYTLTPGQLQASVLVTSGGLTKILRQLEDREMIIRSQESSDRRIKPVTLTLQSVSLVRATRAELFHHYEYWLGAIMNDEEMQQMTGLLQKICGREAVPYYPNGI